MGSENLPLRNIGIYHNLPTFDASLKDLTAIITGANGISGFGTLRALLDSPERWSKIYTLSRRPTPDAMLSLLTPEQRSRVHHVACDFLQTPEQIATALKSAQGIQNTGHIFFYSYLQPPPPKGQPIWSNADELVRVNTALLSNFLGALPQANIKPDRFVLQTGAKNYGVHLGRTRQAAHESDPQPTTLSPNFYYTQEAELFAYTKANPGVGWNVIMPSWIIGAVNNAAMNALHPFAIYAAVQAAKSEPIAFPGDFDNWQQICNHSTARLTGYLTEWAALEPKCKDRRFNATDASAFTFDRFYSHLARWYGVTAGITSPPPTSTSNYTERPGPSGKDAPMGYGPPVIARSTFSFVDWASNPTNVAVWKDLMSKSGGKLIDDPFTDPESSFSCADGAWSSVILDVDSARKLGWTGYVDTVESVREMFVEMGGLGMLPPLVQ